MLKLLKRWLVGEPPVCIDHPVLVKALLIRTKTGNYWEGEARVEGKAVSLFIETKDADAPSAEQLAFVQRYAHDPDRTFAFVRAPLVAEYETWMREPFPAEWRQAFEFVGLTVPLNGDERQPWDVSFDCLKDRDGHMFTCDVEAGKPSHVTIDG